MAPCLGAAPALAGAQQEHLPFLRRQAHAGVAGQDESAQLLLRSLPSATWSGARTRRGATRGQKALWQSASRKIPQWKCPRWQGASCQSATDQSARQEEGRLIVVATAGW